MNTSTTSKTRLSWWQMTSVQVGGAICMPVLMVGEQLGRAYGFAYAAAAICIGNLLLCVLGMVTAKMCFETKANTVENARAFFGQAGTYLLALSMIIALTGWFAIQLNLISLSFVKSIALLFNCSISNIAVVNILLGSVMLAVALYGIKALIRLSDITMPLLVGTLLYSLYNAYVSGVQPVVNTTASLSGISLVLASAIMVVVDIPTYYRFAKSKKDSFISIGLLFFLVLPILELIGVYVSMRSGGTNIVDVLTGGQNAVWQLWVLFFLLFAGWTTNNANIYSATIALKTLFPKCSYAVRVICIGVIGIVASCFDVLHSFESVLNLMGIAVSAIGAVIITSYSVALLQRKNIQNVSAIHVCNTVACIAGGTIGLLSFFKLVTITAFALIDAFIAAAIITAILQVFVQRKVSVQ
jgi:purine-cytosine permease-like protein